MNIDDLTLGQIKEIRALLPNETEKDSHFFAIGENYFIRTVTHIDVGQLVAVGNQELVLKNVSWVADTGRYADAIAKGALNEVEPYPEDMLVIIGRGSIIDACLWTHSLPREQK